MICALRDRAHMLNFCRIDHTQVFLSRILKAAFGQYYDWIIPIFACKVKESAQFCSDVRAVRKIAAECPNSAAKCFCI